MAFLILSISIFVFIVIIMIFYKRAKLADNKKRRLIAIKKSYKVQLDDALEKPFFQRTLLPAYKTMIKNTSNLFPKKNRNNSEKTEKNLKLAGMTIGVNEYNAARLVFSGVFVIVAFVIVTFISINFLFEILIFVMIVLIALIAPGIFLKIRISRRQEEITNQLPDVMDLLSVSMEAGLGFDSALVKISERLKGVLVSEFNTVQSEISLGKARRDALRSLAERNAVEELKSFVASIIQAEQLGISINTVIKSQAKELRIKRRQRAEEKAMKAPVKMLIPLVVFVLPVLFIILLSPSILMVMKQFQGI